MSIGWKCWETIGIGIINYRPRTIVSLYKDMFECYLAEVKESGPNEFAIKVYLNKDSYKYYHEYYFAPEQLIKRA